MIHFHVPFKPLLQCGQENKSRPLIQVAIRFSPNKRDNANLLSARYTVQITGKLYPRIEMDECRRITYNNHAVAKEGYGKIKGKSVENSSSSVEVSCSVSSLDLYSPIYLPLCPEVPLNPSRLFSDGLRNNHQHHGISFRLSFCIMYSIMRSR